VVERAFPWLGQRRRLSSDYVRLFQTSEAMIHATINRIVLTRLARS
jgi:transposase